MEEVPTCDHEMKRREYITFKQAEEKKEESENSLVPIKGNNENRKLK